MAQILETCISTLQKHVFICLDIVYILKNVGLHGFFPSARQTSIRLYHEGWAPLMEVPVCLLPSDPVLAKSPPSNRLLFGCRLKSVDSSQVAIPAVRLTFNCSTRSCATSSDEEGGAWNADGGNWWKQSSAISDREMCSAFTLAGFDFRGPKIQQIWNYKMPGTKCHINWFLHLIIIDRKWIWKCWEQCNFATRPRPCLFYKGGCWSWSEDPSWKELHG